MGIGGPARPLLCRDRGRHVKPVTSQSPAVLVVQRVSAVAGTPLFLEPLLYVSHQQPIEDTMTLQEYFSTEPLGARGEMAEYLGISLTWMSLLIHERRTASAALAVKIEKATQGLVTRKDLRPDLFFV